MTKSLPLALLISAGLLSSTVTASADGPIATNYIIYGNTVVNGTTYNLSPFANLNFANLYNVYLPRANLSNAILSNADLSYANLTGAYLRFANLHLADLLHVNLTGAAVSYSNWTNFSANSGALNLGSYSYDTSLINYVGNGTIPEPSTYGLIGIAALGVAFAARRKKLKTA